VNNSNDIDLVSLFDILTECSPEVIPCSAIFCSIFTINIDHYSLPKKTLKLTLPELMRNPG